MDGYITAVVLFVAGTRRGHHTSFQDLPCVCVLSFRTEGFPSDQSFGKESILYGCAKDDLKRIFLVRSTWQQIIVVTFLHVCIAAIATCKVICASMVALVGEKSKWHYSVFFLFWVPPEGSQGITEGGAPGPFGKVDPRDW